MIRKRFIESGGEQDSALDEDAELKLLEQRKMVQMRKRIMASQPAPSSQKQEKTPREVVQAALIERGDEVLDAAYSFFPEQTERIVEELASMMKSGKLTGKISGGELLSVFRQLGLRFSLKTSIKVQDRGKFVELSEKLKRRDEE
jgi:DNA-binding TFAR19-related protein (PDSD5 family)